MNPELSRELASQHIREMRHEAARCAGPGRQAQADRRALAGARALAGGWAVADGRVMADRRAGLRNRIGFTLVEAGLRVLSERPVTARQG